MRRFSIARLMGLIVVLAVGIAALRGANDHWAGGLMMAAPLLLGVALIGALCGGAGRRAGRAGFAALGGGYFALAFLGLSAENLARLPTSKLLDLVHRRAIGQLQVSVTYTSQGTAVVTGVSGPIEMKLVRLKGTAANGSTSGDFAITPAPGTPPPNRWRSLLPGAVNYAEFAIVGHCLFAMMAGVLGAAVAGWFERRRAMDVQHRDSPGSIDHAG